MKKILTLLICCASFAFANDPNLKAFPPADKGMVRHLIQLPESKDEDGMKVELIIGKTVKVDPVNRHFFAGKIEEVNIDGWGFTRYVVSKLGPLAGTKMLVDPPQPDVEKFVPLGGEPMIIRYNSKLPIAIYVPEGCEVKYKIWRADPNPTDAPKG